MYGLVLGPSHLDSLLNKTLAEMKHLNRISVECKLLHLFVRFAGVTTFECAVSDGVDTVMDLSAISGMPSLTKVDILVDFDSENS